ncbi:DUF6265 family protein [Lutibacter sp.]|uniref:DUF6265 family protein n=1 Tax=Lutibacter sp. TaxID=1925666 RepID=UPI003566F9F1
MKNYLAFLFSLLSIFIYSQNTLKLPKDSLFVKASIEDVSFISGYWQGEAFGGITEEIWSNPLGNSIMGSFKLVVDNTIQFYELCTISEENETLIFRLKHFHNNLKGWEEKDETIEAPLVKIDENRAYFNDFTFERFDAQTLHIYVIFKDKEGKEEEMKFKYILKS